MTWEKRIQEASERGYFTDDDKNDAGTWASCAIGEQAKKLGKLMHYDGPVSLIGHFAADSSDPKWLKVDEYDELGCLFSAQVNLDLVEAAHDTFDKIIALTPEAMPLIVDELEDNDGKDE